MFNFFSTKHFLIDQLEGFIDIHNHILPGIDDGAKNVKESIALIKGFGEFGVTDFICTPHIMENYYPNNPTTINNALSLLQNELEINHLNHVTVDVAAEHMIDSGFEKLIDDHTIMPLAKSYLLIEMSFLQPSLNFDTAVNKIKDNGLFPIFAHPERYAYLHNRLNEYKKLKEKGLLFQLNLLSLTGYYGKQTNLTALKLLENGLFDFLATDVHNNRQLHTIKNIKLTSATLKLLRPIIEKTTYNFQ